MYGETGDDTYVVDNIGDVVTENVNEGMDTVLSSIGYALGANLENLTLTGNATINGTGNDLNNTLIGNSAANVLTAGLGNDVLMGGKGNDVLQGGGGNDLYVFNRGDGADQIRDTQTVQVPYTYSYRTGSFFNRRTVYATAYRTEQIDAGTDTLRFGSDIAYDQLWFRNVGSDLEARIVGTTDSVLIKDWYTSSYNHIERFEAGGKVLLDSQVDALVQAMAAFAPPTAGQTSLPANYHDALAPVLAANWQ
jgi:Ca2+-binding RTX toxin-like protein